MGWLRKEIFRLFQGQRGFNLIEALVAVAVLGLIGSSVLVTLNTNFRADQTLEDKVTATNLATAYLETIRKLTFDATYSNAGDNITIPSGYSVVIDTECSSDGINFGTCTGSANETFQRVSVSVSREEKSILTMCTYKTKR